ncbi:dual specificity protein kinase CLK3-like [Mixophyes fleayi]|uniref:dual specificity protein kinase CLK3-like n=1 Tax=Mixophyes fleayi TaxID=3061075 RepID=UPI003F4E1765
MPEIVGVGDIDTGSSAPQVGQLSSLVLKENNLTHTDMKPENIVFVNSDFETSYNEDKKCEEKSIKNSSIHLIDFELGWSHPCDI